MALMWSSQTLTVVLVIKVEVPSNFQTCHCFEKTSSRPCVGKQGLGENALSENEFEGNNEKILKRGFSFISGSIPLV